MYLFVPIQIPWNLVTNGATSLSWIYFSLLAHCCHLRFRSKAGAEEIHHLNTIILHRAVDLLLYDLPSMKIVEPNAVGHAQTIRNLVGLRRDDLEVVGTAEPLLEPADCLF